MLMSGIKFTPELNDIQTRWVKEILKDDNIAVNITSLNLKNEPTLRYQTQHNGVDNTLIMMFKYEESDMKVQVDLRGYLKSEGY